MTKRVLFLYRMFPAYRLEFYDGLRTALQADGVSVDFIYGNSFGADAMKGDERTLPWAEFRANRFFRLGSRHFLWQPALRDALNSDLVVVEQASRLLINYVLLAAQKMKSGPNVALWGHGANLQTHTASRASEAAKRRYSRLPHWWFAYTDGSKRRVAELGFPDDRITVVQNAIDVDQLRTDILSVADEDTTSFLAEHSATAGHVGVFIGSLYAEKRLDFLIQAAARLNALDPEFVLLVGGDGVERELVEQAARDHSYVRYLGRVDGKNRALALAAADVTLMPGLVGLSILDSFIARAPMVAIDLDFHSPEIEYLIDGENGLLLGRNTTSDAYAYAIFELLRDRGRLQQLQRGCDESAQKHTMAEMIERFRRGILAALEAAPPK